MSYVQKLLGDTENYLHEETIASLASDRFTWRKFVVACSAAEMIMMMTMVHVVELERLMHAHT